MQRIRLAMIWLVGVTLAVVGLTMSMAGGPGRAQLTQYWGTITSIRIDRCGTRPGLCEGAIILSQRQGGHVALSIRPGTWIKRGERLVLMEELSVGNDIHVQAIAIDGETAMRATNVEVSTKP